MPTASESTDPVSLEDEEDGNDETLVSSTPTTPSDPDKVFLDGTSDKVSVVQLLGSGTPHKTSSYFFSFLILFLSNVLLLFLWQYLSLMIQLGFNLFLSIYPSILLHFQAPRLLNVVGFLLPTLSIKIPYFLRTLFISMILLLAI